LSASLRLVASVAAAGAFSMQPVASFAQTAPAACAAPVLDLANPAPGEMLLPGAYTIQGAALDPEAGQGSGIDQVSFFLGDRNAGGMPLGMAQPDKGPRLDDFSVTVTLPSARPGEQEFVAYAHSALTGKETQVSFPIVLGEDPNKTPLAHTSEVQSSAVPAATMSGSGCESAALPGDATSPATVLTVPVPAAVPSTGLAAAEAFAESGQTQVVPDDGMSGNGPDNNQQ
jgi:hypothetical protein